MPWAGCTDCDRIVVKSPVHTTKSKALKVLDMTVSREETKITLVLIYGRGRRGVTSITSMLVPEGDLYA
jgi:hypothetical protein